MVEAVEPAVSSPSDTAVVRSALWDRLALGAVLAVLTITAVLYLVAAVLAIRWIQQPFLGAFVEKADLFNDIRSQGDDVWPAFGAGVRPRDRLRTLEGIPTRDSAALAQALAGRSAEQPVTLTLEREAETGPDESLTLTVTLTRFSLGDVFTYFVIPYFIGLAYLGIGLWVFWLRRAEAAGRVFALFCSMTAVTLGSLFDLWTTHAFTWAWTACLPAAAASIITLGLVFPQEIAFLQRFPALRGLSFLPALGLAAYALYTLYHPAADPRAYILAWRYQYFFLGLAILFFCAMVVYRRQFSASPVAREQSRVILVGAVLAFSPIVWWVIRIAAGAAAPFNAAWTLPPLILFPAAVAYAILRYRLLDTDALVGQALIYAGVAVVTLAGYGLILTGVSVIVGTSIGPDHPVVLGLVVFLLVVSFNWLRERLQALLNATFFRGSRAYTRELESFGRALTRAVGLADILPALRAPLADVLHPAHIHLFLRDPVNHDFAAYNEDGPTSSQPQRLQTDIRFPADGAFAQTLAHERAALYLSAETPLPSNLLRDRAQLAALGSVIYAPLQGQAGLAGWLAVGPKLSGEPVTRQELRFVEALADQSALAVERATVISDLERRVRELDVLSQVSQAVNFTITYDDLMELVYAQTSKIVDTRNFYIMLRDERGASFRYAFFVENNERLGDEERKSWPMARGLAGEIVNSGQPIRTDDYLAECRRRNVAPRSKHFKAWMGVPLNAGTETIGVMSVASYDLSVTFTDDQLKVLSAIADQAASAIVKARLFQQTEHRARQLATLNEVSTTMASSLDLDSLLERIIHSSMDILGCEAGSLFLTDEETGEYIFRVAAGPVGQNLIGTRVAPGRGFVGEAVESGTALIVNDVQNDPRWFKGSDQTTGFTTRALMVVPLRRAERSIGAIELINKRDGTPFDDEDRSLLTSFAGQATVAIENARLFAQTDQALAERVEELSVMQRIDRELNIALDVERVMDITLAWAMKNTGASAGSVGIVTENDIVIAATRGYFDTAQVAALRAQPLPLTEGIMGRVARTAEISLVRDVRADPDYQATLSLPSTQAQLTIPIRREREVVGLVNLECSDPDAFTEEEVAFVIRLLDHASVAITNARLYAAVNAANRAKSDLMDFVAHELKNPMMPIKGYADLLVGGAVGGLNDMQKQFLATIRNNIDRLNTIVSDLNDSASIEAGKLRLQPKSISFQAVVDEVGRAAKPLIDAKRQTLTLDIEPDLPNVWADHNRTVQIFNNLVSNAYKYTPEGGALHVQVTSESNRWDATDGAAPEVLHVSVRDNGIGISPEDQKKLFQKFFRAEDSLAREMARGTGLGLSIVKNLVEIQGGKIWFESEYRKGSTFHFTLPLARDDGARDAEREPAEPAVPT